MTPYDADGDRIDPRDHLDREELAEYQRGRRRGATRRYVRGPAHTEDIDAGTRHAENDTQPRESA